MDPKIAKKIDEFFKSYPDKHFESGYILIYAGYEPPGIFYLEKGQVREYDITDQGNEVVVNVFKPPAFFPMSWAINKTPNQYFFETLTPVTLRQTPAQEAVKFLKDNPDVTFDLLSRLYSGTDGLMRRMAHLMGGNSQTRLLFELVIECRRFGKIQKDGSYIVKITESELAKRAGLSRETVSRLLTKNAKEFSVEVDRQGFKIKDLQLLEEELGAKL